MPLNILSEEEWDNMMMQKVYDMWDFSEFVEKKEEDV